MGLRVAFKFAVELANKDAVGSAMRVYRESFQSIPGLVVNTILNSTSIYIATAGVGTELAALCRYLSEVQKYADIPEVIAVAFINNSLAENGNGIAFFRPADFKMSILTTEDAIKFTYQLTMLDGLIWETVADPV